MANSNFVVHNGLSVGALTIHAANGAVTTTGSISTSGGFDGVDATSIANGTSKVQVYENTIIGFNVGGTANVMTLAAGGNLTIAGDLTVNGTTTTINTATLDVEDLNITVAAGAADSAAANGAGLTVDGASATILYTHTGTKWVLNKATDVLSLLINGTAVTSTATELNKLDGFTGGVTQLNYLDALHATGVTDAEFDYLDGVTSAIQTQLDTKAPLASPTFTTAITTPVITKSGTNNVGDIGQTGNRFANIYGVAVSAKYADLAEKYVADADIEPGTVVHFGGEHEVSTCDQDHCQAVAGVVSTDPAYRMNDALEAEHVAMVALTGRVPCKVTGTVAKGDMMVSAGNGRARAEANPKVGAVIGKALEASEGEAVIEVVVGKH